MSRINRRQIPANHPLLSALGADPDPVLRELVLQSIVDANTRRARCRALPTERVPTDALIRIGALEDDGLSMRPSASEPAVDPAFELFDQPRGLFPSLDDRLWLALNMLSTDQALLVTAAYMQDAPHTPTEVGLDLDGDEAAAQLRQALSLLKQYLGDATIWH